MRSELCRALIVWFSTLVFGSLFLCIQGTQAQDSDTDLESTTQLIVMVDGLEFGAGIIFGWDKERLYIGTANHVIRSGSKEAQSPQIRLKALPDKPLTTTLLNHADRELDLAVLSLDGLDNQKVDPCALRIDRLGRTAMKRGDAVYAVGNPNGVPWGMPVVPDRAAQIVGIQVTFQSAFISKGHSGGGLLNGQGEVVGMIRADQPPFGSATNIENILQALKAWGYPVKLRVANSPSPLFIASEKGSVNEVKRLLEDKCPEVNVPYDGMTPLLIAADKGWGPIVDLLLKAAAQKNIEKGRSRFTPLQLAAQNGSVDVAKLLVDAGADLEAESTGWGTPLALAVKRGHREVARFLIKAGAKTDFAKKPEVLCDAAKGRYVESVKLLLEIGADIEQVDRHSDSTPLFCAVAGGHVEVVKVLLDAGANVSARQKDGGTPLFHAIQHASGPGAGERPYYIEVVKVLLPKAKANIDQKFAKADGYTLLTLAAKGGGVEAVKMLLEAGANVNGATPDGRTALHYAAECCYDRRWGEDKLQTQARQSLLLQLLLKAGANINAKDTYGDPPLCQALGGVPSMGRIEVAEILLKAGSVRTLPDECKRTPFRNWNFDSYKDENEKLNALIKSYRVK